MDDDIIRMAREAGLMAWNGDCVLTDGQLERFFLLAAAAGAAAEREACAQVCFREAAFVPDPIDRERIYQCAAAIRARSKE